MRDYVVLWYSSEHRYPNASIITADSEDGAMGYWRSDMSPRKMAEVTSVHIIAVENMKLRSK